MLEALAIQLRAGWNRVRTYVPVRMWWGRFGTVKVTRDARRESVSSPSCPGTVHVPLHAVSRSRTRRHHLLLGLHWRRGRLAGTPSGGSRCNSTGRADVGDQEM